MPDTTESCSRYRRSARIGGLLLYTPSTVAGKFGMSLPPRSTYFICGILPFMSCTLYARPSCAGLVTSTSVRPSGRSNVGRPPTSKRSRKCTSRTSRSSANGSTSTHRGTTCIVTSRYLLPLSFRLRWADRSCSKLMCSAAISWILTTSSALLSC